jgi:DsbC/DsbD-like thiol-disulfide interchange protein
MITTYLRPLLCCFAAVGAATISPPANAIDASAWHPDTHSAVRLIAGGLSAPDPGMRAGVEIKLDPGWKTYWRYPGDSGVPPRFDFAQSVNVRSVTLLWPVPHHFVDEGGNSIGYKNDVIFPLQVVPQDPAKPVTLRLKIDYAICEKLCVPAVGNPELLLSAKSSLASVVRAAEERVPKRSQLGDGAAIAIRAIHHERLAGRERVLVDVAAAAADPVELFAEGPTPDWALPLPELESSAPAGLRRFAFDLDGLPPGAKADGAMLTLTLVAGENAVEVVARLD